MLSSRKGHSGEGYTWFQLLQSCYHFRHKMERQVDRPNSDHHLLCRGQTPSSPSKLWSKNFAFFVSPSSSPPSIRKVFLHLWAWGRGYLRAKASNMATESKGLHACCTAGCWHLLSPSAPCFILEAPSPTQEPKRNPLSLLSQLPPSTRVRKTIFHKREKENFLSFCPLCKPKVLFIALRCVTPSPTHMNYFWLEKNINPALY